MLNISFVLFCWILPSIPSPQGVLAPLWFCLSLSKMATGWMRPITFQEIELLSFLKQNMIRKICEVADQLNLPKTHPIVCQTVSAYFNLGATGHQVFDNLVWNLAHTI